MMHTTLHPCQTTTNQTLDQTTKAIGQTTTPMKKTTKRLTTPKNSVKSPTPSITPPTWYWTNQKREDKSQWYMHVPLRYNQPKHQWLGKQEWRQVGKIISIMINRNINAYCLQETWQLCDYMLTIRGYTVFHHRMNEKPQRQGQISAGVMIIINPDLTRAWTRARKLKPITSHPTSKFPGQTIGITPSFPNNPNRSTDTYQRKEKESIKIFFCSVYHPHEIN